MFPIYGPREMLGERKLDGSHEQVHWHRRKVGIFHSITGADLVPIPNNKRRVSLI